MQCNSGLSKNTPESGIAQAEPLAFTQGARRWRPFPSVDGADRGRLSCDRRSGDHLPVRPRPGRRGKLDVTTGVEPLTAIRCWMAPRGSLRGVDRSEWCGHPMAPEHRMVVSPRV